MYSIVLMMALSNGAATPSYQHVAASKDSHSHQLYRGRRCHGCSGGCTGGPSCTTGGSSLAKGGRVVASRTGAGARWPRAVQRTVRTQVALLFLTRK